MPFLLWFAADRFFAIAPAKAQPPGPISDFEQEPQYQRHMAGAKPEPAMTPPPEPEQVPQFVYEPEPEAVAKLPKLSVRWRIVGLAFYPDRPDEKGMAYLASIGGYRRVSVDHCEVDQVGDWRCAVEDGFATFYSATAATNPLSAKRVEGSTDLNVPLKGQAEQL